MGSITVGVLTSQTGQSFWEKQESTGTPFTPLGPYPAVYPSENSSVVAEVRRFSGKQQLEIAKSIDYMELFGGYHREYVDLEIEKQKIRGFIYVYDEKPEAEKIEHGDWVHYLREKGRKKLQKKTGNRGFKVFFIILL